jgi:SAM-dependent methyltransferase
VISFEGQRPPLPPDRLIDRVTPGVRQQYAKEDRAAFDASGQRSVREIEAVLAGVGRSLDEFPRILDFGCGCARVLRWMEPLSTGNDIHGCDIDELAISWAQDSLPFGTFVANDPLPPLPYADEHFDLVLNHSVFTHLDAEYQDLWLSELARVLKPGGLALLSVHGPTAFEAAEPQLRQANAEDPRSILERDGILFVDDDLWVGSSFPDFYHTTYHAPWYIHAHWGTWFDIRAYMPHADLSFQDVVVVEKVPVSELHRPIVQGSVAPPVVQPSQDLPLGTGPGLPMTTFLRRSAGMAVRRLVARLLEDTPSALAGGGAAPVAHAQPDVSTSLRASISRQGERLTTIEHDLSQLELAVRHLRAPGSDAQ